jgi:hypothetical protein
MRQNPGRAQCAICHPADYIVRQPGGDEKRWEAEVKKLGMVFGAPTSDANAKVIVEYLASTYGPQAKKPSVPIPKTLFALNLGKLATGRNRS